MPMNKRSIMSLMLLVCLGFSGLPALHAKPFFLSIQALNAPPSKPTNPSPPDGTLNVSTSYNISVTVTDPDGDPMNVSFYVGIPSPNFSIVVLPDTQLYSMDYPGIFSNQTQWIVDNAASMNIVFVTHEGDLVEWYDKDYQWQTANDSMSKLDGHVPWGAGPGNHDGDPTDPLMRGWAMFNRYFSYSRFAGQNWYGGAFWNKWDGAYNNANNYQLFSAGRDSYLILHLQYDPNEDILAWANTTVENYPNRRVIITTHNYLSPSGERSSVGENIWNKFIRYHTDQIFLVLCGHNVRETRNTDTSTGYNVHQLMANYQNDVNGGNGLLRILEFCPAESKIHVKTFSPYTNSYESDADSEFTLDYTMTNCTSFASVGKANKVPSGSTASIELNMLNFSTEYNWYAIAQDVEGAELQSDVWHFSVCPSLGDTNIDGEVDFYDLTVVAMQFGRSQPILDVRADTKCDGVIDIFDLVLVAIHLSKSHP